MDNRLKLYVSVYKVTRAYGGAEEGGWYYSQGEPTDGVFTLCCGHVGEPYEWSGEYSGRVSDHLDGCPALAAYNAYVERYVKGHKEEYLKAFTHAPDGTSWLDRADDAPGEYRGEVATTGKYEIRVESNPPQAWPKYRPHYE